MSYSSCRTIQNLGSTAVTLTYEMELLDANGTVYPTFVFPSPETTLAPSGTSFGCGANTVYDFDFSHPAASSYRLRVRYRAGGASGTLEGTATMASIHQLPPRVVINEFRTRGPNGPTDQFVELFNDSLSPSSGAANLCASPNSLLAPTCVRIPAVTIGPLCHYLITAPGYSGSVKGDLSMPALLHDDGHLAVIPTFDNFIQNDTAGMNATVPSHYEGTPLPPFGPGDTDRAYVRVGTDTNNNERDFAMRAPSSPQNAGSCGGR
jgi:hypothetical protein